MPTINIAYQQSENAAEGGNSRVGTTQSGALYVYADNSFDSVTAEFSTTVAPFPQDGPYAPTQYWLNPVLPGETTTGWAYFEPTCEECG
jgi:hypothetical protein